jgi:hypothetical protein
LPRITERAADTGARYVHTFVGIENMPSLKGCVRAGFPPHQWRTQRLRLFKRHTAFAALPMTFAQGYAAIAGRAAVASGLLEGRLGVGSGQSQEAADQQNGR